MAQPTNTFDTYDMSGIREQLSDIIYNISPTDTPMFSSMGKGKATNTQFKWLTDSLAAASAANHQVDGDDYTATAQTATEELHTIHKSTQRTLPLQVQTMLLMLRDVALN